MKVHSDIAGVRDFHISIKESDMTEGTRQLMRAFESAHSVLKWCILDDVYSYMTADNRATAVFHPLADSFSKGRLGWTITLADGKSTIGDNGLVFKGTCGDVVTWDNISGSWDSYTINKDGMIVRNSPWHINRLEKLRDEYTRRGSMFEIYKAITDRVDSSDRAIVLGKVAQEAPGMRAQTISFYKELDKAITYSTIGLFLRSLIDIRYTNSATATVSELMTLSNGVWNVLDISNLTKRGDD